MAVSVDSQMDDLLIAHDDNKEVIATVAFH
jgi:hypothetical protein